jgi:signal transduction histidine kinase
MANLVSNGIRYASGGVLVGARRGSDVELAWDTGIGIPFEQQQDPEDFYQVGNPGRDSRQARTQLAIVRRLTTL